MYATMDADMATNVLSPDEWVPPTSHTSSSSSSRRSTYRQPLPPSRAAGCRSLPPAPLSVAPSLPTPPSMPLPPSSVPFHHRFSIQASAILSIAIVHCLTTVLFDNGEHAHGLLTLFSTLRANQCTPSLPCVDHPTTCRSPRHHPPRAARPPRAAPAPAQAPRR